MKRILSLLLVLAASLSIIQARTISGTVISDSDSTAVIGATCRLLADKKLLSGTSTNADGAFSLQTDIKSVLTLEISMTGYESTEILIESGAKNINLGRVFLNEG
ncbi:MAG: carboxypeptidase-like regulatory domain-containing protein, partial [Muribaculaceae bacterium]|nr:carboxypeptidase-like regulatory domain-containing protein [Muribaculaceae bacterium]